MNITGDEQSNTLELNCAGGCGDYLRVYPKPPNQKMFEQIVADQGWASMVSNGFVWGWCEECKWRRP